jgi:hypothetical protein
LTFLKTARETVHRIAKRSAIAGFTVLFGLAGCNPEPTVPATTNLAGTWTSSAHIYALRNFKLQMIQEPRGIVSGKWFADGDGGGGGCLRAVPCKAFGDLIGRNTVSQVEIELLGAGRFDGVLLQSEQLRGTFSVNATYDTITFVRTSTSTSFDANAGGR